MDTVQSLKEGCEQTMKTLGLALTPLWYISKDRVETMESASSSIKTKSTRDKGKHLNRRSTYYGLLDTYKLGLST